MKTLITLFFVLIAQSIYADQGQQLVVVINAESPIERISREELIGIYMGRYLTKSGQVNLSPLDNERYIEDFYALMIEKTLPQVNSYWARLKFTGRDYQRPQKQSDTESVLLAVLKDTHSISYIPADQVNSSVKVIYAVN